MDLKRVMVRHLTNYWSCFFKCTNSMRILTLKKKTRLKWSKTKLVPHLTLKLTNGHKTSHGETLDKLLVFFYEKYHFLDILDTKTQKPD